MSFSSLFERSSGYFIFGLERDKVFLDLLLLWLSLVLVLSALHSPFSFFFHHSITTIFILNFCISIPFRAHVILVVASSIISIVLLLLPIVLLVILILHFLVAIIRASPVVISSWSFNNLRSAFHGGGESSLVGCWIGISHPGQIKGILIAKGSSRSFLFNLRLVHSLLVFCFLHLLRDGHGLGHDFLFVAELELRNQPVLSCQDPLNSNCVIVLAVFLQLRLSFLALIPVLVLVSTVVFLLVINVVLLFLSRL